MLSLDFVAPACATAACRCGSALRDFAYGCYQWLCIVAVLGFARRWLTADSAARRYLTDAIFPYYIVHQTAIIMIAHALRGSGLSAGVEAAIVIGGTAATCVATLRDRAAHRPGSGRCSD